MIRQSSYAHTRTSSDERPFEHRDIEGWIKSKTFVRGLFEKSMLGMRYGSYFQYAIISADDDDT